MTDILPATQEGQARASLSGALAAVTPSSVEAFKAISAKYGISSEDVAKTLGKHGIGDQSPAAPQSDPNKPTVAAPAFHPNSHGLTPEQLGVMADKLLAAGMDPATVHAAMDQEGLVQADDERGEEEILYDSAFAGAGPNEYDINWGGRIPEGISANDLPVLNNDLRGALSAMGFPARIGGGVLEQALDDARVYGNLDETGQGLWDRQQRVILGRAIGDDQVPEAIKNAAALLALVKDRNPGLHAEMLDAGLFRSARVIAQLHMQAERMFARVDMAERRTGKK